MNRIELSDIIVVDPFAEQYRRLLHGLKPKTATIALNSMQDGIVQITDILQWHQSIQHIHIVSHASPGELKLGSIQLNLQTLPYYTELLSTWFPRRLQGSASISVYACRLATGNAREEFLTKLHQLTGANVHMSSRPDGNHRWKVDMSVPSTTAPYRSPFSVLPFRGD